ncbi:MAG: nitrilase-related carbon-nitrogen hydrolase [Opitutaceae bacterium]
MKIPYMRVACTQTGCFPGDVPANLRQIDRLAGEASAAGAALVVFPELMTTGYASPEVVAPLAERIPGPVSGEITRMATHHRIALAVGLPERSGSGDACFNTLFLVDAEGRALLHYRKVHLWDTEKSWARGGDGFPVHLLGDLHLGANICYDVRFPEGARSLALAGAQLMLLPTAWLGPVDEWELAVRSRAMDNGIYVAASALQGESFLGSSLIVDPHGTVIGRGDPGAEQLVIADIDPAAVARFRRRVPLLRDRQPDCYSS